jgi:hypothetical protein
MRTLARTHQRCDRKPPDAVVVVITAMSEASPDGARSIRPTSARCRGCH